MGAIYSLATRDKAPTLQHPSNHRSLHHYSKTKRGLNRAVKISFSPPPTPHPATSYYHQHQQYQTNLWRLASDGELSPCWTTGSPVALYTAECKFLHTNKQPSRQGWLDKLESEKAKWGVGGWVLQQARSRGTEPLQAIQTEEAQSISQLGP